VNKIHEAILFTFGVLVELLNDVDESQIGGQVGLVVFNCGEKFLEDFGESGEEAFRAVGCRDIRRFAGF
jgi:hypothetical protein